MPKWTFQAVAYKVLKHTVEAETFKEAEEKAEAVFEKHVEDEDYRRWERDKFYIHGHPDDYPTPGAWNRS